jgi:hypothetical protein
MTDNNKIKQSLDKIEPSESAQSRMFTQINDRANHIHVTSPRKNIIAVVSALAACMLLTVGVLFGGNLLNPADSPHVSDGYNGLTPRFDYVRIYRADIDSGMITFDNVMIQHNSEIIIEKWAELNGIENTEFVSYLVERIGEQDITVSHTNDPTDTVTYTIGVRAVQLTFAKPPLPPHLQEGDRMFNDESQVILKTLIMTLYDYLPFYAVDLDMGTDEVFTIIIDELYNAFPHDRDINIPVPNAPAMIVNDVSDTGIEFVLENDTDLEFWADERYELFVKSNAPHSEHQRWWQLNYTLFFTDNTEEKFFIEPQTQHPQQVLFPAQLPEGTYRFTKHVFLNDSDGEGYIGGERVVLVNEFTIGEGEQCAEQAGLLITQETFGGFEMTVIVPDYSGFVDYYGNNISEVYRHKMSLRFVESAVEFLIALSEDYENTAWQIENGDIELIKAMFGGDKTLTSIFQANVVTVPYTGPNATLSSQTIILYVVFDDNDYKTEIEIVFMDTDGNDNNFVVGRLGFPQIVRDGGTESPDPTATPTGTEPPDSGAFAPHTVFANITEINQNGRRCTCGARSKCDRDMIDGRRASEVYGISDVPYFDEILWLCNISATFTAAEFEYTYPVQYFWTNSTEINVSAENISGDTEVDVALHVYCDSFGDVAILFKTLTANDTTVSFTGQMSGRSYRVSAQVRGSGNVAMTITD